MMSLQLILKFQLLQGTEIKEIESNQDTTQIRSKKCTDLQFYVPSFPQKQKTLSKFENNRTLMEDSTPFGNRH